MKINIAKKKNVIKILIDLEFLTLDSFSETVLGKIQRSRSLKRSVSYAVYDIYNTTLSAGVPIASELFLTESIRVIRYPISLMFYQQSSPILRIEYIIKPFLITTNLRIAQVSWNGRERSLAEKKCCLFQALATLLVA